MKTDEKTETLTKILRVNMGESSYYHRKEMSAAACLTKRTFDIVGSVLGLVVFSPVFLLIYCLIKHEDGGRPYSNKNGLVMEVDRLPSTSSVQ